MKNKAQQTTGWLDNFNDSKVNLPTGFVGEGIFNGPNWKSPAWGGQFQNGGELPLAQKGKKLKPIVTNNPADPRLHKYLDSLNLYKGYELSKKYNAQDENSKLVPKTIAKGEINYSKADVDPHNSYEDYLKFLKKYNKRFEEIYDKQGMKGVNKDPLLNSKKGQTPTFKTKEDLKKYNKNAAALVDQYEKLSFREPTETGYWKTPDLYHPTIREVGSYYQGAYNPIFKKPNQPIVYSGNYQDVEKFRNKPYIAGVDNIKVQDHKKQQPVVVQKPIPHVSPLQPMSVGLQNTNTDFTTNLDIPIPSPRQPEYYEVIDTNNQNFGGGDTSYRVDKLSELRDLPEEGWERKTVPHYQMGGSLPGATGMMYARIGAPSNGKYAKHTLASAQNGQEMKYYQEGLDWKPKTISKSGAVIKDDMGYWNPNNWNGPVEIGSNEITMQNVPFDVLGISDEGDVKHMKSNNPKNYKFKGKKVTEFRMAKNGLRQEQKSLINLDQLTNFTNYNKPQPSKWLSKYE